MHKVESPHYVFICSVGYSRFTLLDLMMHGCITMCTLFWCRSAYMMNLTGC